MAEMRIEILRDRIAELEAENASLKLDAARLDWLEQQLSGVVILEIVRDWHFNGRRYSTGMRDAIDAALAQSAEREKS